MKVLLTTDGSKQAEIALQTASHLLHKERHSYELLCVAPKLDFPHAKATKPKIARLHQSYQDKIKREAGEIALHTQARLATQGIQVATTHRFASNANYNSKPKTYWPPRKPV
jgi:nucleotide-binding universal stress UspA family protein